MKIRIGTTEDASRHHHYAAVVGGPEFQWLGTLTGPFDESSLAGVDALIVSCEHHYPSRLAIAACKRLGIPTFHVLDGIAEWRNLFENPRSSQLENGPPLFQPLLSDWTFAMGEAQRRTLQWLGNERVLATGLPRFDAFASQACRAGPSGGSPTLMVATANTPWFTAEQEITFSTEFHVLAERLGTSPESTFPGLAIRWRVARIVAEKFGLANDTNGSALDSLATCDALVTTPSSLAVEAMLLGVPTLIFDPYASPVLTPSAWSATSAEGVLRLLPGLLAPDPRRAHLQDTLRDSIASSDRAAASRIAECITAWVRHRRLPLQSEDVTQTTSPQPLSYPSNDSASTLSPAEVAGLMATLPALERVINDSRKEVARLYHERENPTFRHSLGCLCRSFRRYLK